MKSEFKQQIIVVTGISIVAMILVMAYMTWQSKQSTRKNNSRMLAPQTKQSPTPEDILQDTGE